MTIRSLKFLLATFALAVTTNANAILIGDKDWRQVTDTVNISYNDLVDNSICDPSTGICAGDLTVGTETVNFDGWIWASLNEVGTLFDFLVPPATPKPYFTTPNSYFEKDSAWAPIAIDSDGLGPDVGYFDATYIASEFSEIQGITRTLVTWPTVTVAASGHIGLNILGLDRKDVASTTGGLGFTDKSQYSGMWMYREVPEPSIIWLLGSGLALIGFARRKKA